ncbi:hypothetical protein PTTG_10115 [Puccinia triticina 1-1 BBBD Race 1]|uniref:Uncharacterized protein n=1 Tax=Puccinia triticina (isolate 1-1 / race 1 (BBBD)) TaxID=630390 RepID=A0A180GWF2_PUCT1|nr:hypothetical protein PTTG_10115 [Puccinia triticina 1-1 BBBD Race 1]
MDSSRRTEQLGAVSIQQTSNRATPADVRSSNHHDSSSYHNKHGFGAGPQPQAPNSLSYAGAYATPTARPALPGTYASARPEGPSAAAAATNSYTPASFYTPRTININPIINNGTVKPRNDSTKPLCKAGEDTRGTGIRA